MRSYINSLADFKAAKFDRIIPVSCPQEYIDRKMKNLSRSYKKTVPVTEVARGDVVILSLSSNMEKFNRSHIPVTVGGGLYDQELEAQLTGHKVHERFAVEVGGNEVTVEIESGMRTIFPEPTDEMVKDAVRSMEDMEGIETVAQYRERIIGDYVKEAKENAVYQAMDDCIEYVLTNSDWEFDEEELQEIYQLLLEDFKQSVEETFGKTLEEVSDEELKAHTECDTKEEFLTFLRQEAEREIAMSLFLISNHALDPASVTFEKAEELEWDFLIDYIKEQITFKEGVS